MALLPAPSSDLAVQQTVELAERRMLTPAREAGYELRLVGATVLPQRQTISRTKWGTWLFVDNFKDPTAASYGGRIPVPEAEIARLTELDRAGVRPQHLWLGHQLPDSYKDGDALPQLVPPPRRLREQDERLRDQLSKATSLLVNGAAATLAVVAAPLAAVSAVGLDPIVFGGVRHPELPVVGWCALAQWDWE